MDTTVVFGYETRRSALPLEATVAVVFQTGTSTSFDSAVSLDRGKFLSAVVAYLAGGMHFRSRAFPKFRTSH